MDVYSLHRGAAPLLISLPHDGTEIPPAITARMTPEALRVPDTDWHVGRLYEFAKDLGASILAPRYSRYVVDLNRAPDGAALYPGQNETGLVPTITFGRQPIYAEHEAPDAEEIRVRADKYWRPYHLALQEELHRIKAMHHRAVLWEGHSIRSEVPMFFEGTLPDLNLGTANGASCSSALQARLTAVLASQDRYRHVANGRFKGGYITRHYGRPDQHIEAVQLELAQFNYMDEDTFAYDKAKATPLQAVIRELLKSCL